MDTVFYVLSAIWSSIVRIFSNLFLPNTNISMLSVLIAPLIIGLIMLLIHKLYDFGGVSK